MKYWSNLIDTILRLLQILRLNTCRKSYVTWPCDIYSSFSY